MAMYQVGDFVFCRLRGYRPWPSRVKEVIYCKQVTRYRVKFYGTYDHTICAEKSLTPYNEESLSKVLKLKNKKMEEKFQLALQHLKEDLELAKSPPQKKLRIADKT